MEIAQIVDIDERKMFLDELGLKESGLDQVIHTGYDTLGLQTFYTSIIEEERDSVFI